MYDSGDTLGQARYVLFIEMFAAEKLSEEEIKQVGDADFFYDKCLGDDFYHYSYKIWLKGNFVSYLSIFQLIFWHGDVILPSKAWIQSAITFV